MALYTKLTALAALISLSACSDPYAVNTIPGAEPVSMRAFAAEHKNKTLCTDYQASTNSCFTLMKFSMKGDKFTIIEKAAVNGIGGRGKLTMKTHAWLEGNKSCTNAKNIQLLEAPGDSGAFLLAATRQIATQMGGLCSEVWRAGDTYIYRVKGRNGESLPPGDIKVRIAPEGAKLRAS